MKLERTTYRVWNNRATNWLWRIVNEQFQDGIFVLIGKGINCDSSHPECSLASGTIREGAPGENYSDMFRPFTLPERNLSAEIEVNDFTIKEIRTLVVVDTSLGLLETQKVGLVYDQVNVKKDIHNE